MMICQFSCSLDVELSRPLFCKCSESIVLNKLLSRRPAEVLGIVSFPSSCGVVERHISPQLGVVGGASFLHHPRRINWRAISWDIVAFPCCRETRWSFEKKLRGLQRQGGVSVIQNCHYGIVGGPAGFRLLVHRGGTSSARS